MCVRIHFLTPFAHLFTEQYSFTPSMSSSSLSLALSAMSHPKSSKTPATENPSTSGPQVYCFSAHTDKKQAHCSLCTAIVTYILLCGHPFFVPTTPPSPSRTPTPELNFSVRPCFRSSQILYLTSRCSRSSQRL